MTPFPITTFVRLLQVQNAESPRLVTLSGIVIFVMPLFMKAKDPILITLFGIVILVKFVVLMKARFPMFVTLLGIVIVVKLLN